MAQRILETQREGCRVVAVVSAMAGVTDDLVRLGHAVAPQPTKRELDILLATGEQAAERLIAMAVNALGGTAISLTGAEAGSSPTAFTRVRRSRTLVRGRSMSF